MWEFERELENGEVLTIVVTHYEGESRGGWDEPPSGEYVEYEVYRDGAGGPEDLDQLSHMERLAFDDWVYEAIADAMEAAERDAALANL